MDAAVRNALDKRSDLRQAKNILERSDLDIRYLRNQILPDISSTSILAMDKPRPVPS